jgi:hypothetical protein
MLYEHYGIKSEAMKSDKAIPKNTIKSKSNDREQPRKKKHQSAVSSLFVEAEEKTKMTEL